MNNANASSTEAAFLNIHLSISNGRVLSKNHDKRDDFNFDVINFTLLNGDIPCSTSNRFSTSSHITEFNAHN